MKKKSLVPIIVVLLLVLIVAAAGIIGTLKNKTPEPTSGSEEHLSGVSYKGIDIPSYSGSPYIKLNGNKPFFEETKKTSFEEYSDLDSLGRCGVCVASVGKDIMPTEDRGSIGQVKPTGWQTVKYDFVDGKYLYNRCHLIGFQLTGENANTKNLITGTRYLNVTGMLPFENMVADFVKETKMHVMYRVTPLYYGNELVARGVVMEALSVEDGGEGIEFCIFCYNVQPGVVIDYMTGESSEGDPIAQFGTKNEENAASTQENKSAEPTEEKDSSAEKTYILNTSSKKFHFPDCSNTKDISEKNRETFVGSRDELVGAGYSPCQKCNP